MGLVTLSCSLEAAGRSRDALAALGVRGLLNVFDWAKRPRKPSVEAAGRIVRVGVGMADVRGWGRRDVGLGRPLDLLAVVEVLGRC